jgi:hypothetical protein
MSFKSLRWFSPVSGFGPGGIGERVEEGAGEEPEAGAEAEDGYDA